MPYRTPLTAEFDATVLAAELPQHVLAGHMRYRQFRALAEGGKAEVFRCCDAILAREVALKVLRRELVESPLEQQLLVREARICAAMRHTAVPEVYDLGRDPDGRPFYTMSLKLGSTLHEVFQSLRRGDPTTVMTFDLERLLGVLVQVASALVHAHQLNVVHCDLKPENIIVDTLGAPTLIDWGLAFVDDYADEENPILQTRGCQGSPLYMSPEQAAGDPRLTSAVDVYGLGVLLYECVTLDTPHRGETKRHTLQKVLHEEPPALATGSKGVTPELAAVCHQALRRSPAERFGSIGELRDALEECRVEALVQFERPWAQHSESLHDLGAWNDSIDARRATDRKLDGDVLARA
jgi:serine/threonine-protein kinase